MRPHLPHSKCVHFLRLVINDQEMLLQSRVLLFMLLYCTQVPGNENPSVLISYATKTVNAGQVASKLHVIELDAQPGPTLLPFFFFCVF